jgi:hypothetical protein
MSAGTQLDMKKESRILIDNKIEVQAKAHVSHQRQQGTPQQCLKSMLGNRLRQGFIPTKYSNLLICTLSHWRKFAKDHRNE